MSTTPPEKAWPKIREHHRSNGTILHEVDFGRIAGKRQRRFFPTKEEAEACARRARARKEREGRAGIALSDLQRAEAAVCFGKLAPSGASLTKAVDFFLEHATIAQDAPPVLGITKEMLVWAQTDRGVRPRTLEELKYRLGGFCRAFGDRKLDEITVNELEVWFQQFQGLSPRSRINFRMKLIQFYNFAKGKNYVKENRAEKLTKPIKDDEPKIGILKVDDAKSLLHHAPQHRFMPYLVLGLFGGFRRAEIERLDWSAVDWEKKEITVGAKVAKKRYRRVVEMNETLRLWLHPWRKDKGRVTTRSLSSKTWRRLLDDAGIAIWPKNALRHSFASYYYPLHGETATVLALGQCDQQVMHDHYRKAVSKTEAERFWRLRPEESPENYSGIRVAPEAIQGKSSEPGGGQALPLAA